MRWQAIKYLFWTYVRQLGAWTLSYGDKLYWAGKQGQRRNHMPKGN